jgi:diaminopimelate epimerase
MVAAASPSPLQFSKMHGAGNDFIVLDLRTAVEPGPALCRTLADRRTGVGCDLILGVAPPRSAHAVASYLIWTADGSVSPQCGNGARCIAAWLLRAGIAQGPSFILDSPIGTHSVEVLPDRMFRVAMGVPEFAPERIPLDGFTSEREIYESEIEGRGRLRFAAVSMGNPHAVIEVMDVRTAPVAETGPALQQSRYFPRSVNVGFAEVVGRDRIKLRVYEYGAGEALGCGTGACAAAAILIRQGRINHEVRVSLPGGELSVTWEQSDAQMMLTGPAAFVFEGCLWVQTPLRAAPKP